MAAEETRGLDLFDENASAVGNFPQTLRGYDRGAVDAYVREVEAQLSRAKSQLRQQQRQLIETNARAGVGDYTKLGAHTRALLRVAESQAEELVSTAEQQARQLAARAEADAAKLTTEARLALGASSAATSEDLRAVRQRLSDQTALELQAARIEGAEILDFARQQAAALVADATARAELIVREAGLAAETRLVAADREAAEHRLGVVTEKEAAIADVKAAHEASTAELEDLLAKSRSRVEEHAARLAADSLTWEERREAARAEAAEIVVAARTAAAGILTEAEDRGQEHRAAMLRLGEEQKAALEADVELLTARRKAVVAQLGDLSTLAGTTAADYGDGDPSQ